MKTSKKAERTKEIIGICLDCFVEKGLRVTTTTDLCNANNLQNGGIYYYFDTKEEIVLACAEEAISRIEQGAFSITLPMKNIMLARSNGGLPLMNCSLKVKTEKA